jgi:TatD DNase family protein
MDVSFDDDYVLPNVDEAMAAAKSVNVTKVIQVGCDVVSSKWAANIAAEHPDVWATVALHPNAAAHDTDLESSLEAIAELAQLPQVRGLGETGLDYYRTEESQSAKQHISFRAHREVNKPVIIHDRDAHRDVIDTLETHGAPETVVFHCFSGDADMAKVCAQAGWYMSVPGVVTFKNAQQLRDAVLEIPDHLLLVETDSPFLTPAPNRGNANASINIPWTVRAICEVRGQSEQEICELLFSNAARVFGPF